MLDNEWGGHIYILVSLLFLCIALSGLFVLHDISKELREIKKELYEIGASDE